MVPHRGTNWAVLWLIAQIGRDAMLSKSYGRGCKFLLDERFSFLHPITTLFLAETCLGPGTPVRPTWMPAEAAPLAHRYHVPGPRDLPISGTGTQD